MAALLVKEGEKEGAAELLVLVLHHPAGTRPIKDRAERLLADLASQLPPKVMATARERGKGRTLEEVAEQMLKGKCKGIEKP